MSHNWDHLINQILPKDYSISCEKKSERMYAKNAAVDRTYQVKIDEGHHGERIEDIRDVLHQMFDHVLEEAWGDLVGKNWVVW